MENVSIEEAAKSVTWQGFEKLVSEILKENGFVVRKNFRFKTDRKYEIDLIAARNNLVLCIDCKQWRGGRSKKHGLLKAVSQQENRLKEFVKVVRAHKEIGKKLSVEYSDTVFKPLIVTLSQEIIVKENKTFIVPVFMLNSFLLEIERYL